jgi:hypothetical protein
MPKVVIVGDMTFGESGMPAPPPQRPGRPTRPTDPDYGIDEGEIPPPGGGAGQLPVWPIGPDHGLPPIAGQPLPPINPPPGTVWPPLPPSIPEGKTLVYAGIAGVGHRYIVIDVKPPKPGQGLPPSRPGRPEIDPPDPNYPDQGLPHPEREPKRY